MPFIKILIYTFTMSTVAFTKTANFRIQQTQTHPHYKWILVLKYQQYYHEVRPGFFLKSLSLHFHAVGD